jgi:hypothetical protein
MTRAIPFLFPPKSVGSVLDYGLDFGPWLEQGDSIVAHNITATPSGLTVGASTLTLDGSKVIVSSFVGGGVIDTSYLIEISITTAFGLIDIESGVLNVLDY